MAIDHANSIYLDCSTNTGNTLGNGVSAITMSQWILADTTGGNDGVQYIGSLSNSQGEWQVQIQSNIMYFGMSNLAFNESTAFSDTASWHHLVTLYNGAAGQLYLDNVKLIDEPHSTDLDLTGLKVVYGTYYNTGFLFDGKMFDPRVYNRVLSPAEIQTLYNARGSDNIVNGIIVRPNEQGLNGATVTSVADLSTYGNTITVNGTGTYLAAAERNI